METCIYEFAYLLLKEKYVIRIPLASKIGWGDEGMLVTFTRSQRQKITLSCNTLDIKVDCLT